MHPPTRTFILCFFLLAAFAGCYPGDPDTVPQSDVVITLHRDSENFGANRTWAMADTVWPIIHNETDGVTDIHDSMIVAEVTNAMIIYGYERILDPSPQNPPDVYITIANIGTNTGFWNVLPPYELYCTWWDYCDTCCAPGWFPDYPPGYPSGLFSLGTLFIDMCKPGNINQETGAIPVIWTAIAHGVMELNQDRARENTRSAVRRAFAQSPYLKVN